MLILIMEVYNYNHTSLYIIKHFLIISDINHFSHFTLIDTLLFDHHSFPVSPIILSSSGRLLFDY